MHGSHSKLIPICPLMFIWCILFFLFFYNLIYSSFAIRYICFGYYYKVLLLPIRFISLKYPQEISFNIREIWHSFIQVYFVDVNHWIELFFYCPILFFSLYMVNQIVFRESKKQQGEEFHTISHKLRKAFGMVAIGLNFCISIFIISFIYNNINKIKMEWEFMHQPIQLRSTVENMPT